jgi:hypothetical protein
VNHRVVLAGMLVGLGTGAVLSGCATKSVGSIDVIGPALTVSSVPSLELDNSFGPVTVRVDPRLTQPEIRGWTRNENWLPGSTDPSQAGRIKAESVDRGGHPVLMVSTSAGSEANEPMGLIVTMPACRGVRIRSSGGKVDVAGAGGPFFIQSGADGRLGGDIEVRTQEKVTEEVTLTTNCGAVLYRAGPGSTGIYDLMADDGQATFDVTTGRAREVRAAGSHWQGRLNGGDNHVTLRSGHGPVRAAIVRDMDHTGPEGG